MRDRPVYKQLFKFPMVVTHYVSETGLSRTCNLLIASPWRNHCTTTKLWACVSVCPSVCRVPRPNSRTERPRKPKIEAHHMRNQCTYLDEVKRSKIKATYAVCRLMLSQTRQRSLRTSAGILGTQRCVTQRSSRPLAGFTVIIKIERERKRW